MREVVNRAGGFCGYKVECAREEDVQGRGHEGRRGPDHRDAETEAGGQELPPAPSGI